MAVQNLCDHLEAAGQVAHLCNPVLLQELVEKIPAQLRLDWALYKRQLPAVDLRTFSAYMSTLVVAASDVTIIADTKSAKPNRSEKEKERNFLNTHSVEESTKKGQPSKQEQTSSVLCLVCEDPQHKVKNCAIFKKLDPDRRWKLVQDNHLCRTCLGKHGRRPCKVQSNCGTDACQMRHHPLLHAVLRKQEEPSKEEVKTSGEIGELVNAHHSAKQSVLFKILPVRLFWKGRSVETFAFLDDGSSMTLVEDWIAKQLGIYDGETLPLCLSWTSNITRFEPKSQRVSVEISGASQTVRFALNDTRTVMSLNLPKQSMNFEELAQQHAHLRGLPLRSYESVSPGILIGSNNASLIAALKLREGQLGDPIASKTRLGWTLSGMAAEGDRAVNLSLHICERSRDRELHEMVEEFSVDSVGVAADKGPESDDDKQARSILERTTRRVSKGFGILWRYDHFAFPDSYAMVKRRLEYFEQRMRTDPELRESVQRQIGEFLESDYIHRATVCSADPAKVWNLPLGAVRNPRKPGKIRLDLDAVALEMKRVHSNGGFTIGTWLSNSAAVLRRVGDPGSQHAKVIKASKERVVERVLGMKAAAYVIRVLDNGRRRRLDQPKKTGRLLQDEIQRSEAALWRMVQATANPDEVAVLLSTDSTTKKIKKSSDNYKLSPFADERNVLRVDSRIGARKLVDQFRRRWTQEYLPSISGRTKWFEETEEPKMGDLVVLLDASVRNGWTRGRIISAVAGRDGRTRQVVVQTANGVFRRPMCKVAVLDVRPRGKAEPKADKQRYRSGSVEETGSTALITPRRDSTELAVPLGFDQLA